ncbi:SusD/RagB family nutrient-binding outer membrane lipoprotein [Cyclobacterium sp. SYSU L10401]|uniref:SusD/RagB family nutrient-binding outer membrane lipoprotein n=1 Tax=Cyclobacterium sp. SYSU L10401 TaxID=2678657 RepID=UPI0013D7E179|nr:SusD/RagB family nutrient-binding outer membrane lipoprotein [Cyclobacterium sp. SYSU L10401]
MGHFWVDQLFLLIIWDQNDDFSIGWCWVISNTGNSEFSSRATSEINEILSNPTNYPIVSANDDNITFRKHALGTLIGANDFQGGLEEREGNVAVKVILEHMLDNEDPRLTYVF